MKSVNVTWIWRYRFFCTAGIIVMIFQVFIALIFFISYQEVDVEFLTKESENNYISDYEEENQPPDDRSKQRYVEKSINIFNSAKFEKINHTELNLLPICDVISKESVSAIKRAKSSFCKQLIANVSCMISSNVLYPRVLPHLCPAGGLEKRKSLGCFLDNHSPKTLFKSYYNFSSLNSVDYCIDKCIQAGYPYAGVQSTDECYCGNEKPPASLRTEDSSCSLKCLGDSRQTCGGYLSVNIFETGIERFKSQIPDDYKNVPNSLKKLPVRVVFMLTLNGRSVRQVYRLIKVLFHPDHYFFIHVDARQDYMFRELLSLELHFQNIRLLRYRYETIWGGASLLTMLLRAMSELVQSSWNWDFIINLSESDFPIKSNEELVSFLAINRNRNFVKSHGRDVQHFISKQGLSKSFVECEERMWRIGDRALPAGIVIDGGSDWIALSRTFVNYIVTHQNSQLLSGLRTLFKYTLLPAETYFHTALRNTRFCNSYVDNNLHVTNWKRHLGCKCQYKHVVDWCGCSPNAFTMDDWPRIQSTKKKRLFFARKFEPVISQSILDKIEAWMYNINNENYVELTNQHGYWQNMYHFADSSPPVDDALYTVGSSLSRITSRKIKRHSNCGSFETSKLLQIHSYHRYDQQLGVLIEQEISSKYGNQTLLLETWFTVLPHYRIIKADNSFGSRLTSINVNSNYDTKEQISRNFLKAMGPFTEPMLIFQVLSGSKLLNVSFVWIDPTDVIADISTALVEEQPAVHHVKPNLVVPHLPGIWKVNIISDDETVAQVKFLISPIEVVNGNNPDKFQLRNIHGGSSAFYRVPHNDRNYLLSDIGENRTADDINALIKKSRTNSLKTDSDLRNWIDSYVVRFYKLVDNCVISSHTSNKNVCSLNNIVECKNTIWSSYAVDPKSDIMTLKV